MGSKGAMASRLDHEEEQMGVGSWAVGPQLRLQGGYCHPGQLASAGQARPSLSWGPGVTGVRCGLCASVGTKGLGQETQSRGVGRGWALGFLSGAKLRRLCFREVCKYPDNPRLLAKQPVRVLS